MRKIKYIASAFLISIVMVFIGEMYIWNLDSFETEYLVTTFYLQDGCAQETMIEDIEETAEKNNCLVFVVNRKIDTVFSETLSIYGMEGTQEIVSQNSSVEVGEYKSLFLGNVTVRFQDFKEIPDVSEIESYYLIGDLEDARQFKSELVNSYAGSFPREGYTLFNAGRNVALVWGICILFFLLLSLYETTMLKKEMIIRFVYGENLLSIVAKYACTDVLFFVGFWGMFSLILRFVFGVHTEYMMAVSITCLLLFVVINTLLFVRLIFVNYKNSLNAGRSEKAVLNISYIFNAVISLMVLLIMTLCMSMIDESVTYWRQKDFFRSYDSYSYISVSARSDKVERTEMLLLTALNDNTNSGKAFLNMCLGTGMTSDKPCLLFNKNTIDYLKSKIPELSEYNLETGKIYFIVPENKSSEYIQDLEFMKNMYISDTYGYETILYDVCDNIEGIVNSGKITSDIYSDPLIILDLRMYLTYFNGIYISQSCMFNITEDEWQRYVDDLYEEDEIYINTTYMTNVYDNYIYYLSNYQRILVLSGVSFLILFVLELIVIKTILRYECTVNAREIVLKTTLGYPVLEKYRKIFLSTMMSLTIGAIASTVILAVSDLSYTPFAVISYVVMLLLYFPLVFYHIRMIERTNIQRILKGGVL